MATLAPGQLVDPPIEGGHDLFEPLALDILL